MNAERPGTAPDPRPRARRARRQPDEAQELRPGEAHPPEDQAGTIQELIDNLKRLDVDEQGFARSLIGSWFQRDGLTLKQWRWVDVLINRARRDLGGKLTVLALSRDRAT